MKAGLVICNLLLSQGSRHGLTTTVQDAQSRGGGVLGRRFRRRDRDSEPENAVNVMVDLFKEPTEAPIAMGRLPAACGEAAPATGTAIALLEAACRFGWQSRAQIRQLAGRWHQSPHIPNTASCTTSNHTAFCQRKEMQYSIETSYANTLCQLTDRWQSSCGLLCGLLLRITIHALSNLLGKLLIITLAIHNSACHQYNEAGGSRPEKEMPEPCLSWMCYKLVAVGYNAALCRIEMLTRQPGSSYKRSSSRPACPCRGACRKAPGLPATQTTCAWSQEQSCSTQWRTRTPE